MTGSAERAGVASMAAVGHAADGGTALATRRSATVAAVAPAPKPAGDASASSSAVPKHPKSSRPALSCLIAAVPHSGSEVLCEALRDAGVRPLVRSHPAGLPEARFSPLQYVFLWRRDTARQAISYYCAVHELSATGDAGDPGPVDMQQIRWFEDVVTEQRESWRRFFAAGGIQPIEVQYESLVDSYTLRPKSDERTEAILAAYLPMRDSLAPKGHEVRWDQPAKRFVIGGQAPRLAMAGS